MLNIRLHLSGVKNSEKVEFSIWPLTKDEIFHILEEPVETQMAKYKETVNHYREISKYEIKYLGAQMTVDPVEEHFTKLTRWVTELDSPPTFYGV